MGAMRTEEIYEQMIKPLVAAERLRLVERIVHDLTVPENGGSQNGYKWASIRGAAPSSVDGRDSQEWVSSSRRASDIHRKHKRGF